MSQAILTAVLLALAAGSGVAQTTSTFRASADAYFDQFYLPRHPTFGTTLGLHQYDTHLESAKPADEQAEIAGLHDWDARFAAMSTASMDQETRADYEMLRNSIRSALLTLEVIRPLHQNPDFYSSGSASTIFTLISRKFAPAEERLRSVIARENQIPSVLASARTNLRNPPEVFTDIAMRQLEGIIGFFGSDVPLAFRDVHDEHLQQQFKTANSAVIQALRDYQSWLKTDLMPRSKGDFAIGREAYAKKLAYDEMVDLPLAQILEIGYRDLRRNQTEFKRLAKELDPEKQPSQVLEELGNDHPAPDHLLQTFLDTFGGLIGFINQRHIIRIPSPVRPTLEETPPFMRATTFASMDTPGPFETVAKEAYFNVTLPDPTWDAARQSAYMRAFNVGTIVSTAVHEAYPGHYIQLLYSPHAPSRIRKIVTANSNIEGWAHYCEQMMMEQGFAEVAAGGDRRRALMIRLGQVQDALLRDARYVVGIQMHTRQMTMEQARQFFVSEGYQNAETARVETDRGTGDPTYLYYTLGKLEILQLREDLHRKQGNQFSLESFHTAFVEQGYPPIKVIRQALLNDNSPVLAAR